MTVSMCVCEDMHVSLCGYECLFVSVCVRLLCVRIIALWGRYSIIIKILSIKHNFILLNY